MKKHHIMLLIGIAVGLIVGIFLVLTTQKLAQNKTLVETEREIAIQEALTKWDEAQPIGKVQTIVPVPLYGTIITTNKEIFTIVQLIGHMQIGAEARRITNKNNKNNIVCFTYYSDTLIVCSFERRDEQVNK